MRAPGRCCRSRMAGTRRAESALPRRSARSSILRRSFLAVPLGARGSRRRKDAVVDGAGFADQPGALQLGLRDKSDDLAHLLSRLREDASGTLRCELRAKVSNADVSGWFGRCGMMSAQPGSYGGQEWLRRGRPARSISAPNCRKPSGHRVSILRKFKSLEMEATSGIEPE